MKLEEFSHIVISVVTVSIAFAISWTGSTDFTPEFASIFIGILLTVGMGFVLHELAHKYVAIGFGAHAEYRSWTLGLALAVGLAVFAGFVFAAPGAVYIYGRQLSREAYGKIAIAGPLTNVALALIFFTLGLTGAIGPDLAKMGASVNAFLGLFNIIPIFPLDGSKVMAWNFNIWLLTTAALAGLMFLLPGFA